MNTSGRRDALSPSRRMRIETVSESLRRIMSERSRTPSLPPCFFQLLDLLGEGGERLLPGVDEAVVGDLEDRRLRILVDGDDHLAALHAGEVLDRAGDGDGD